jgi:hypothetical protein
MPTVNRSACGANIGTSTHSAGPLLRMAARPAKNVASGPRNAVSSAGVALAIVTRSHADRSGRATLRARPAASVRSKTAPTPASTTWWTRKSCRRPRTTRSKIGSSRIAARALTQRRRRAAATPRRLTCVRTRARVATDRAQRYLQVRHHTKAMSGSRPRRPSFIAKATRGTARPSRASTCRKTRPSVLVIASQSRGRRNRGHQSSSGSSDGLAVAARDNGSEPARQPERRSDRVDVAVSDPGER